MIATFVLFLREGLEASLIVSILFAALRQLDQMEKARAVWIGVSLAHSSLHCLVVLLFM